jgi:cyclohexanecarboxyl-CoA dehydrogenase
MSGFGFTDTQESFRKVVRSFAQKELQPGAKERSKLRAFPHEIHKKLAEAQLTGLNLSEKYGGQPSDWVSVGIAIEELSKVDILAAWLTIVPVVISLVLTEGSEEIQEEWIPPIIRGEKLLCIGLTEPDCGNDAAAIKTRAIRKGDNYIINGEKTSVSGGLYGHGITLYAKTDPEAGARGISCLLVPLDLPGITKSNIPDMGWHGLGRAAVSFDDVEVPRSHLLGNEGEGFYMIMGAFDMARAGVGLLALGIAQAALEEAISYAKLRTAFGKPIAQFEGVSFKIAEDITRIEAGRLLCYRTLWLKDQGLPHTKEAAMCKWYCPEIALQTVHNALIIHGNYGYSEEFPIEQRLRDVIATEIMDGTPEIQKLIISREIIGKEFLPS